MKPDPPENEPKRIAEQLLEQVPSVSGGTHQEAKATSALEQGVSQAPPPLPPPNDPVQTAQPASPDPATTPPDPQPPMAQAQRGMPQIADDNDLIEKEWVDKAKEIVAHTGHDPYLQNREMNKVKAEYLRKRYNKDLKQAD